MLYACSASPLLLFLSLLALSAAAGPLTVGIMPFANNSLADRESVAPLSKGLADMMITELSKIKSLKVIERADLDKIIREAGLSQAGITDESAAQNLGKLLGADLLLLGSFNNSFGGELRIDARLVKVETGETVKAEEATGSTKRFFKLVKKLSFKMAENLNLELSKEEKKALDNPENEDYGALLEYSRGLDAEDHGDFVAARDAYQKALAINKDFSQAKARLDIVNAK
ncbi:MAG: CsgG/HfaB family protein [Fibrobacterota bacterium]